MSLEQFQFGTRTAPDALGAAWYIRPPYSLSVVLPVDSKKQARNLCAPNPSAEFAQNCMPHDWRGACIGRTVAPTLRMPIWPRDGNAPVGEKRDVQRDVQFEVRIEVQREVQESAK
jgi:hypothetical protein